jgi:hypothetical protein
MTIDITPSETFNVCARDRASVFGTTVWMIVTDVLRDTVFRNRMQALIVGAMTRLASDLPDDPYAFDDAALEIGEATWAVLLDIAEDPVAQERARKLITTRTAHALRDEFADLVRQVFEDRPYGD